MMSASQLSNTQLTEPQFEVETRGGWEDPAREIITAVCCPGGIDVRCGDELVVNGEACPRVEIEETVTVRIEMGGWIEGDKVEIDSFDPCVNMKLSESEFQSAWGDWLQNTEEEK